MSTENVRFHAAGHIAAALVCVQGGHIEAAKKIMAVVTAFGLHPKVSAPPQLIEKLTDAARSPNAENLELLEQWFCDPLNTTIERSHG